MTTTNKALFSAAEPVRAEVVTDFTDATNDERFVAGSTVTMTAGQFVNLYAAGLVRTPSDPEGSVTVEIKIPAKRPRTAKRTRAAK